MRAFLVILALIAAFSCAEEVDADKPKVKPIIMKPQQNPHWVKVVTVPKGDARARGPAPVGCPKCECKCANQNKAVISSPLLKSAPKKSTRPVAKKTTVPAKKTTVPAKKTTVPAKKTTVPAKKTTVPAKKTPAPKLSTGTTPAPAAPAAAGSITLQQLRACMPGLSTARGTQMLPYMNSAMAEAGITSCPRKTAFLAQLGHESASLVYMEELASGAQYEGRKDLGNVVKGDGKRYKGRGPIQLTGRTNYKNAGAALKLNLIDNPTIVATPAVGFRTSAWFWTSHGLNGLADQNNLNAFHQITRIINGGTNGAADRDSRYRLCKAALKC